MTDDTCGSSGIQILNFKNDTARSNYHYVTWAWIQNMRHQPSAEDQEFLTDLEYYRAWVSLVSLTVISAAKVTVQNQDDQMKRWQVYHEACIIVHVFHIWQRR